MTGVGSKQRSQVDILSLFHPIPRLTLTCPQASALPGVGRGASSQGDGTVAGETGAGLWRTDEIDEAVICWSVCNWAVEKVAEADASAELFWG